MSKSKIDLKSRVLCQLFKETYEAQKKAKAYSAPTDQIESLQEAVYELCNVVRDLIEEIDRIGARKNAK